jgi:hypothetical protein
MTTATTPIYEIWDVETGNLIADHTDEATALLSVREGVNDDGIAAWATVALMRVEAGGNRVPIAQGADLLARAVGGADGRINVGGLLVEPSQFLGALTLLDALTSPGFQRAIVELRATLVRLYSEVSEDLHTVEAAADILSKAAGIPLRVDTEGARLSLVTPSKALAGVLAVGVSGHPTQREIPIRAVPGGYAIDIAA